MLSRVPRPYYHLTRPCAPFSNVHLGDLLEHTHGMHRYADTDTFEVSHVSPCCHLGTALSTQVCISTRPLWAGPARCVPGKLLSYPLSRKPEVSITGISLSVLICEFVFNSFRSFQSKSSSLQFVFCLVFLTSFELHFTRCIDRYSAVLL